MQQSLEELVFWGTSRVVSALTHGGFYFARYSRTLAVIAPSLLIALLIALQQTTRNRRNLTGAAKTPSPNATMQKGKKVFDGKHSQTPICQSLFSF